MIWGRLLTDALPLRYLKSTDGLLVLTVRILRVGLGLLERCRRIPLLGKRVEAQLAGSQTGIAASPPGAQIGKGLDAGDAI